jgi:hypothetical protein
MAVTKSVRVGTYGVDVRLATNTDLSVFNVPGCQTLIVVKKGEGAETTWTATIVNPTATPDDPDFGVLKYTLQPGDLDEVGNYTMHAKLIKTSPPITVFGDQAVLKVTKLY